MERKFMHIISATLDMVDRYLEKYKDLGFDVAEISTGFLSVLTDDWAKLIQQVQEYGMKPKPELGIQFGAGGDTPAVGITALGQNDPQRFIQRAKLFFYLGMEMTMIESEGITENVENWRTDVISTFMRELSMEKMMFDRTDPPVYT